MFKPGLFRLFTAKVPLDLTLTFDRPVLVKKAESRVGFKSRTAREIPSSPADIDFIA